MDQAHAIAAISRRHQRAELEPKVWEAASNWNLENFLLFEETTETYFLIRIEGKGSRIMKS